jgi:hypothetical protein
MKHQTPDERGLAANSTIGRRLDSTRHKPSTISVTDFSMGGTSPQVILSVEYSIEHSTKLPLISKTDSSTKHQSLDERGLAADSTIGRRLDRGRHKASRLSNINFAEFRRRIKRNQISEYFSLSESISINSPAK